MCVCVFVCVGVREFVKGRGLQNFDPHQLAILQIEIDKGISSSPGTTTLQSPTVK